MICNDLNGDFLLIDPAKLSKYRDRIIENLSKPFDDGSIMFQTIYGDCGFTLYNISEDIDVNELISSLENLEDEEDEDKFEDFLDSIFDGLSKIWEGYTDTGTIGFFTEFYDDTIPKDSGIILTYLNHTLYYYPLPKMGTFIAVLVDNEEDNNMIILQTSY